MTKLSWGTEAKTFFKTPIEVSKKKLSMQRYRKYLRVLNIIDHPLRLKILNLISENESLSVTDIYRRLSIDQAVASSHLSLLRSSGMVYTEREGKKIFYSINIKRAESVFKAIKTFANGNVT